MSRPVPALRRKRRRQQRVTFAAMAVTALALAITLVAALRTAPGESARGGERGSGRVLAILPFQAMAHDPNTSYFGIGLADSIISHMSRARGLTVRPMSAALQMASRDGGPVEAGRRLDADAVLSGRYQQVGSRFQVTVQLVDVATGFSLWGRTFETGMEDLIAMEGKLVREIRGVLAPDPEGADPPEERPERDAGAHYLYMLARGKLGTWETRPVPEAVELLEEAIRIDPEFAAAHASLAEACASMYYGGLTDDYAWIERAIAAGRRAIHLDAGDPAAHYALGYTMLADGNPVEAAREALAALEIDPQHAYSQMLLSGLLSRAGAIRPALDLADRTRKSGLNFEGGWVELRAAIAEGRGEEVVGLFEAMLDRRRRERIGTELPVSLLGFLAFQNGDAAAGLRWAAAMEELSASRVYPDVLRMLALSRTGDLEAVRRIVATHRASLERDWEYSEWIAMALGLVGEKEEAFEWLARSARLGSCDLLLMQASPALDPLRTDPRFEENLSTVRGRARDIIQLAAFAGYR